MKRVGWLLLICAVWFAGAAGAAPTYTYDDLGRVKQVTYADGSQITYSYDAVGNRTTLTSTLTPGNQPPVTVDDTVTVFEDETSKLISPLTGDTDPNGDTLSLYSVSNGIYGSAVISPNNKATYTPHTTRTETDHMYYVVIDTGGSSATGVVTINLTNKNPTPNTHTASVIRGQSVDITPFAGAGADTDPGNDPMTVTAITSGPTRGSVTIDPSGTILTYTADHSSSLTTDTFAYTVTDIDGGHATGHVNLTISNTNHPPVCLASPIFITATYSGPPIQMTGHSTPRCADEDNDPLTYNISQNPTKGAASVSNNELYYTYGTLVSGAMQDSDQFFYRANDGVVNSAPAVVNVSIHVLDPCPPTGCP